MVLKLSLLPKLNVLAVTTTSSMLVARSFIWIWRLVRWAASAVSLKSSKPMNEALSVTSPVVEVVNEKRPSESVRHPSIVPIIKTLAPASVSFPSVTVPETVVCAARLQAVISSKTICAMRCFMLQIYSMKT